MPSVQGLKPLQPTSPAIQATSPNPSRQASEIGCRLELQGLGGQTVQVLAHDDGQGATGVGQAEEGGAEGAQGIGPGGGQQEHHRVTPDSSEVLSTLRRQLVGLDGQQIQVRIELTQL